MGAQNDTGERREVVGILPDQPRFEAAVGALLEAGFERADISLLASHESLEAAASPGDDKRDGSGGVIGDALTAMVSELRFAGPLGAAGMTILFGGPVGLAIGSAIAAGVGGVALHEVLSEALSHPDLDDFARAVEAGGIIVWVRVTNDAHESLAESILAANAATNIHLTGDRKD